MTRKVKTNLDLLEQEIVSCSGICWAISKSASHCRQITMPAPTTHFLQVGCLSCHPSDSVAIKALKIIALFYTGYLADKSCWHQRAGVGNVSPLGNLVLDEQRMRAGHWLGSVCWVSSDALKRLGDRKLESHLMHKKFCCSHLSPEVLFWNRSEMKTTGKVANPGLPGNYHYTYIVGIFIFS